jgi:hypothetical protein
LGHGLGTLVSRVTTLTNPEKVSPAPCRLPGESPGPGKRFDGHQKFLRVDRFLECQSAHTLTTSPSCRASKPASIDHLF